RVHQLQSLAVMAQRALELPRRVETVVLLELLQVLADDKVAVRLDRRLGGKLVCHTLGKLPAAEIDCLAVGVVQLNKLQVGQVIRAVIEDFVDDDARLRETANDQGQ